MFKTYLFALVLLATAASAADLQRENATLRERLAAIEAKLSR